MGVVRGGLAPTAVYSGLITSRKPETFKKIIAHIFFTSQNIVLSIVLDHNNNVFFWVCLESSETYVELYIRKRKKIRGGVGGLSILLDELAPMLCLVSLCDAMFGVNKLINFMTAVTYTPSACSHSYDLK